MSQFNGTALPILTQTDTPVQACLNSDSYLSISYLMVETKKVFSIVDITQRVRYQHLIIEEIEKSTKLLKTVLPPSLVERVQSGEKNISFSVQSCSVLF